MKNEWISELKNFKIMKARIYTIALLSVVAILVNAQPFSSKPVTTDPIQSQQIMAPGTNYSGMVYEPFSNTTPSEQSAVGASYSPAKAPGSGPRKGFDTPDEPGQSDEFPVGDALLPLLLMAVAFCGVVYLRRRKSTAK